MKGTNTSPNTCNKYKIWYKIYLNLSQFNVHNRRNILPDTRINNRGYNHTVQK